MDSPDNLSNFMSNGSTFTEDELRDITVDVLLALKYLHDHGIIHQVGNYKE